MRNIIEVLSESGDKGLKCEHRHWPDMKNYIDMPSPQEE